MQRKANIALGKEEEQQQQHRGDGDGGAVIDLTTEEMEVVHHQT